MIYKNVLLLGLLFCGATFLSATVRRPYDGTKPTEYIMEYVLRSGTTVRGGCWLDNLKTGESVSTNYLGTRNGNVSSPHDPREYTGVWVFLHTLYNKFGEVPVDTVKGYFDVACDEDGNVSITSTVVDTEVKKDFSDADTSGLLKMLEKDSNADTDSCSTCSTTVRFSVNPHENELRITREISCKSTMTLEDLRRRKVEVLLKARAMELIATGCHITGNSK